MNLLTIYRGKALKKYLKKNLIFLTYDRGRISLNDEAPNGVTLDLIERTWQKEEGQHSPFYGNNRSYKIGEESRIAVQRFRRYGIIGVYDKTKLSHLQNMLYHVEMACWDDSSCVD